MLRKTFLLIASILLLAMLVNGLFSFQAIKSYSDGSNFEYLKAAATQAIYQLKNGASPSQVGDMLSTTFQYDSQPLRLTLIQPDGSVVFDNSAEAAAMDNHLARPEIASAIMETGTGSSLRTSDTTGIETLYLAVYNRELGLVVRTAMPVVAYQTGLSQIVRTMVIIFLLVVTVLLLLGFSMLKSTIRPLEQLQKATTDMAAGNYTVRVQKLLEDDSEVAVLARSFNRMAEQLQTNMTELEDKNARLDAILDSMTDPLIAVARSTAVTFMNLHAKSDFGHDLDPAKAVYPLFYITHHEAPDKLVAEAISTGKHVSEEMTLITRNGSALYMVVASPIRSATSDGAILTFHDISEIRKAQKIRSDFVSNVTHELKTPLTSIRGFIETLRQGAIGNPDVARRFIDIIDVEAERLHNLINDILILSEIEEIKEEKDSEVFNIRELIDDVIVLLDDVASEKKVSLITDEDLTPLPVKASSYRIKQILINLIENAIKYNRPNGRVYVQASRDGQNRLVLKVRDTGTGIAAEHQDRIFERFYRVDKSRSRDLGGTGLGLSIVKHIAQLYGGQAVVRSEPGVGSEFTVVLKI